MFTRLLAESLRIRWKRKLAAVACIALGTAGATALLAIFLGVGDLLAAELRRFGATIDVRAPGGGTFAERDLVGIHNHFWKNNIAGFAPFLDIGTEVDGRTTAASGTWIEHAMDTFGETTRAGLVTVSPDWTVTGRWMRSAAEAMAGKSLARARGWNPGDVLRLGDAGVTLVGVFESGTDEEDRLLIDLSLAQRLAGKPGRVDRVLVNAVVTPESHLPAHIHKREGGMAALIRQLRTDPTRVPTSILEELNCTPYPTTIALQIERKIPGVEARPIRRITETHGAVIRQVRGLFSVLAVIAVVAGGLGVMASMTAAVLERRAEIGLLKALGASDARIASLILTEVALLGVVGGLLGGGVGSGAARIIGRSVFGTPVPLPATVALLTILVAVVIALAGAVWPLRVAVRIDPRRILHES